MKEVHVYSTSDSLFWRVDLFPKSVSFASSSLDLRVKSFHFRIEQLLVSNLESFSNL